MQQHAMQLPNYFVRKKIHIEELEALSKTMRCLWPVLLVGSAYRGGGGAVGEGGC